MHRVAVINVVGLTEALLGPHTPRINAFRQQGFSAQIEPAFPAVTCTAQANYLTGLTPAQHGIVGNGWYNRELAEVQFWKQSNHLVQGRKIWEELKEVKPSFTCAKLFWWYNMYSTADYSITPRPIYPADGRKIFDIYTFPFSIHPEIKHELGEFPFPTFWGPAAGKTSPQGSPWAASEWIANAARWIEEKYHPHLSLIYLPHLDYNLQRFGPSISSIRSDLAAIDRIVGELIDFLAARSVQPLIVSEYGITDVDTPIHLNRVFRDQGWLALKEELGLEMLDCGASKAFAVADHQVAHIYLNDPSIKPAVVDLVARQDGVDRVEDVHGQERLGIRHPRSGDLVALAKENAWFTYYYWKDDSRAPDFARCVDIHRKPGFDPVELFLDPNKRFPKMRIALKLLRKKIGMRMLMDLIPLDGTLVKGSHGIVPQDRKNYPIVISPKSLPERVIPSTTVYQCIKEMCLG